MTPLHFDIEAMTRFLVDLLNIHSPTGYHTEAIDFVHKAFASLNIPGLTLSHTGKGALMGVWEGESSGARRGITAHVDTLGLMVKEINGNGSLKMTPLGGIVFAGIEYENVTIRTHDDRRYRGTVLLSNPSSHVNRNAASAERSADTMEVRIDAKVKNAGDVRDLGIEVGDFIFLDPRVEVVETGFIRSRFLDDKASVACIYGALAALNQAGFGRRRIPPF